MLVFVLSFNGIYPEYKSAHFPITDKLCPPKLIRVFVVLVVFHVIAFSSFDLFHVGVIVGLESGVP